MNIVDIIIKRDGEELSTEEINYFVREYTRIFSRPSDFCV